MTPIFTFLITSTPALLVVIVPIVMTWRIVMSASRNLETIDRTIRLGKYILPRWAAWHIPGILYLILAVLNIVALFFIDPQIGSRYSTMGPGWETTWSLYTLLIGLPLMLISYIALPCSLYIWIRIWLLSHKKDDGGNGTQTGGKQIQIWDGKQR